MLPTAERFTSHDGVTIHEQSWTPEFTPRAEIALVHGLIEHGGRHATTALELVRAGYAVHAMDLRGHGRSGGRRGDVPAFDRYLLDLDLFFARVRERACDRPLFLMGNSMGGLIVSTWTALRKPAIAGLILTGPLLALADSVYPWQRYLARAAAAVAPKFYVPRLPLAWLSRNTAVVENFRTDPLVCPSFTVRVARELMNAIRALPELAPSITEPLLILHGGEDHICGPQGSRDLFREAASADKTLQIYDGLYHEVLDEPERQRVLTDLIGWLDRHAPPKSLSAPPIRLPARNPAETARLP